MTQAELRAQVRELIGSDTYDRSFKDEWTNDALNWACDQTAALLGLTRTQEWISPINKNKCIITSDAIKIVTVRVATQPAMPLQFQHKVNI